MNKPPIEQKPSAGAKTFQEKLEKIINEYSMEKRSDTPDFILAEYLLSCLHAFEKASNENRQWHKGADDVSDS